MRSPVPSMSASTAGSCATWARSATSSASRNYTRTRFGPDGPLAPTGDTTGAGLELVPTSLAATCREAQEVSGRPILVTEHGADLDDARDDERARFIEESLGHLADAIAGGLDVRGYLHWSLIDNYEWFNGYQGHFGLMGVDRATQRRWVRPSATILGRIARANRVGF